MQRSVAYAFLGLFAAVLGTPPALAAKRVALVVGNADYTHTQALKNPVNDAEDMARTLKRLGFDVTSGVNLEEDAFTETVARFVDKMKGAQVALFFYAGHGLQHQSTNYLVPVDARLQNQFQLKSQTLSLNDIVKQMEAEVPVNLVFLDACRNNPLAEALKRSLKSRGRALDIDRGLARVKSSSRDTLIAFAAAPGAIASDGVGRNSPFTAALLKHIGTPGVEVEVMLKRVTGEVRKSTGQRQEPERLSKLTTEFYFKPGKAAAAAPATPVVRQDPAAVELAFWNSVRAGNDVGELNSYLAQYPKGRFAGLARARIARIRRAAKAKETTRKTAAVQQSAAPVSRPVKKVVAVPAPRVPQSTVSTEEEIYQSALAYVEGRGVAKDYVKAINLFIAAGNGGHAKAMYAVAAMYEQGAGVTKNLAEAARWYRKAAQAGVSEAAERLAIVLQQLAPQRSATVSEKEVVTPRTEIVPFEGFRKRIKRRRHRHRHRDGHRKRKDNDHGRGRDRDRDRSGGGRRNRDRFGGGRRNRQASGGGRRGGGRR